MCLFVFLSGLLLVKEVREDIPLSEKTWRCQGNRASSRNCQRNLGKSILLVNNGIK